MAYASGICPYTQYGQNGRNCVTPAVFKLFLLRKYLHNSHEIITYPRQYNLHFAHRIRNVTEDKLLVEIVEKVSEMSVFFA